jgi:DNA (cytosine-5)-methyltransferase 1
MGGIRLGLEQSLQELGLKGECVFTSEIKPHAIYAYKTNFPNSIISGDISKIESKNIPDFDILLAGFPCQPFSAAGKQLGFEDTRGTLFFEIARILKEKQPNYFLLENVENLVIHGLNKDDKNKGIEIGVTLKTILEILKELGYNVSWKVLPASDFGVAQIRRRLYIVGSKEKYISLDNFPVTHSNFKDVQEHINDIKDTDFTLKIKKYLSENNLPLSHLYDKSIRDKRGKDNNLHSWNLELRGKTNTEQRNLMERLLLERRNKEKAREKGVPLKDGVGLTYQELEKLYDGKTFDKDLNDLFVKGYLKKYNIETFPEELYDIKCGRLSFPYTKFLDPNKPSLTLVATDVSHLGVIDGNNIRQLTIRECLRLNGFPENYILDIPYTKALDLLGNTVVVPVIKQICLRIFE